MNKLFLRDNKRNKSFTLEAKVVWKQSTNKEIPGRLILNFYNEEISKLSIVNKFYIFKEKQYITTTGYVSSDISSGAFLDEDLSTETEALNLGYDSVDQWILTRYYNMQLFEEVDKNWKTFNSDIYDSLIAVQEFFKDNNIEPLIRIVKSISSAQISPNNKPSLREKYLIRRLAQGKITDEEYLEYLNI